MMFHSDDFFKFQTINLRANGRESEYLALAKQTHGLSDSTKSFHLYGLTFI